MKTKLLIGLLLCLGAFAQDEMTPQMIWGTPEDLEAHLAQQENLPQEFAADKAADKRSFTFDVANNGFTFSFGPGGGGPGYGAPFLVKGYIYPGGFFAENGVNSGINPDGTAEFPEAVIGEWSCRGWLQRQTAADPSGLTIQQYDFNTTDRGKRTLLSNGFEIPTFMPYFRAIVGGTGIYQRASGQILMQTVGFNGSGSPNFTFVYDSGIYDFKNASEGN